MAPEGIHEGIQMCEECRRDVITRLGQGKGYKAGLARS